MRLYLVRHAHTQINPDTNAREWGLSEKGIVQAQKLLSHEFWEQVDHIFLSSEEKTFLTVQPVLETYDIPTTIDARFDELRRSGWTDDYLAQVTEVFAHPDKSISGWDSATSALTRFRQGIDAIVNSHSHETVAVVGHGLTMSLYRAYLLGYEQVRVEEWQQLGFGTIAEVEISSSNMNNLKQAILVRDFE
ncbi:MAG: histidine phosphatase family protein [Chloroflexota bacterium]